MPGKRSTAAASRRRQAKRPITNLLKHADPHALATAQGVKPMTVEQLRAMSDVWPEGERGEDFDAWLRQTRREGNR